MGNAHLKVDTITYFAAVSACEKGIWGQAVHMLVVVDLDTITYYTAQAWRVMGIWL